jgi:hypothetical protein
MPDAAGETKRREEYERLYAAFTAVRRTLHGAAAAGADPDQLRPLQVRLRSLRVRLAAWQGERTEGESPEIR